MEEVKNEEVNNEKVKEENVKFRKAKKQEVSTEKKNTFTLIYILVGIFAIAILAMLAYAFIVTK